MRRLSSFIVFLILVINVIESCTNYNSRDSFHDNVVAALNYEKKGNYKEALDKINSAIEIDSSKSFAFVVRGKIRANLDDDLLAIEDFSHAIILNPKNTSAYFQKGISFSLLNKEDSAIAYFNYAIDTKKSGDFTFDIKNQEFLDLDEQTDVDMAILLFYRGLSFYESKKDSLALNDFNYSLNHGYSIGESQFYIGVILISQKKSEGCIYLKKAIENGNKDAGNYFNNYCK